MGHTLFNRITTLFLVEEGIDTISVTPELLIKIVHAIHEIEQELKKKK